MATSFCNKKRKCDRESQENDRSTDGSSNRSTQLKRGSERLLGLADELSRISQERGYGFTLSGRQRTEIDETKRCGTTSADHLLELLEEVEANVADEQQDWNDNYQNGDARRDTIRIHHTPQTPIDWTGCVVAENAECDHADERVREKRRDDSE